MVENEAKYCRSASKMKCLKKGDRRGVIISEFVSYERCKLRDDDDTHSTRILPIPASLVY